MLSAPSADRGSGLVAAEHLVIGLKRFEFVPAGAGCVIEAEAGCLVIHPGLAGGAGVAGDATVRRGLAVVEHHIGRRGEREPQAQGGSNRQGAEQGAGEESHHKGTGAALRGILAGMMGHSDLAAMYTDWTAVILLLLTAAPLAVVVATAAFFIRQQQKKPTR